MPMNRKALGKISITTLIVGALLLGGYRWITPHTDPGLAPMTLIVLLAIIISSLIEFFWQKIASSRGDRND